MNLTLSPQIKILGLVGLLAAVGLMASMTLLGHSSSNTSTNDAVTSVQRAPRRHTAPTAVKPAIRHTATPTTHAKARTHATFLGMLISVVTVVLVLFGVSYVYIALFFPLIQLISKLSG